MRIGAELGPESRLGMPVGDFLRVKETISPIEVVDGFHMIASLRMIKSPAEVARIRRSAQIVSAAFEALPSQLKIGDTEQSAGRKLRLDILGRGAQSVPYLTVGSKQGGYTSVNSAPSLRVLRRGDLLALDTGSTVDGYYSDFDRNYAIGKPSAQLRGWHELVWDATEDGLKFVRPGVRTCDIWQVMVNRLKMHQGNGRLRPGRHGHGIGLRLTEPPSLSQADRTVVTPGMVLTLEPSIAFTVDGEAGPEERIIVHEENIIVTEDGCDLLTRRASRELPVID